MLSTQSFRQTSVFLLLSSPCHPLGLWNPTWKPLHLINWGWKRDSVEDFQRDFYGVKVICIMSTHCSQVRINHKPTSTCKGTWKIWSNRARRKQKYSLGNPHSLSLSQTYSLGNPHSLSLPQTYRKVWIEVLVISLITGRLLVVGKGLLNLFSLLHKNLTFG